MKIVIDVPEDVYKENRYIAYFKAWSETLQSVFDIAEPLSDITDRMNNLQDQAETKAYFDGQAFGWEEGRSSFADDMKAELLSDLVESDYVPVSTMLELIDKHKGETYGK